ncbi:MAG: hypothetical protein WED04_06325 [Promethearchaeati archaeon SRVP18_Atabeyarchaeia-1]
MRKSSSLLLVSLILATMMIASFNMPVLTPSVPPPSASTFGGYPQTSFSPPASQSGNGYPMDLTESVNGWQSYNLNANNTFAQYSNRTAFFYNNPSQPAWQDITIKNIVAANDIREIQGGDPTADYGCGQLSAGPPPRYPMLAMSLTPTDTVNITVIRLFYSAFNNPPAIMLHIVPDSGGPQATPAPIALSLGYGWLSNSANPAWHNVSVSTPTGLPITLTGGTRYWIVMDGSSIVGFGNYYQWYYSPDPTPPPYDEKLACYYTNNWKQESDLGPGWNFLALVRVLPVSDSMQPRQYSSPAQVNMYLYLNATTQPIDRNTTQVGNNVRLFMFVTNTSVTFTVNWTARMEVFSAGAVTTRYIARDDFTLWNATFTSDGKPGNPYTWYNKTFKVTPIPPFWNGTAHPPNIWNNRTYVSSFTNSSSYYLISQISNLSNAWNSDWLISVKSIYAITVSVPSKAIEGCAFNLTISAPLAYSSITINAYNSTDSLVNSTTIHIGSSTVYSLKLNKGDNYNITFLDTYDLENEVSFATSEINVVRAQTAIKLASPVIGATWGDIIALSVRYLNETDAANATFPSSPVPAFRVGSVVATGVTQHAGGCYNFSYSTRNLPSAGSHLLTIYASYNGAYLNQTAFTLNLSKIPMSVSLQVAETSVTVGSSLSVSAALKYGNGTSAPNGFGIQFNFIVTYTNGSVITIIRSAVINGGVGESSLPATSDMKSINVNATYLGDGITKSASDLKLNIEVVIPQGLSLLTIAIIGGGGGALVVALVGILRLRSSRKRTEERKAKVLMQTTSLAQLIVVHLASGRALYSRSIGSEESVDPNLISGFLSANQAILGEVFKKQTGAGLKFADYGQYKVVSNVGNYIMATLFCTEAAGEELQGVLRSFTENFEKKYAATLKSWDGDPNAFKGADDVADEVFAMPLCSPYMLLEAPSAKLNRVERAAVHTARMLSAERGVFFMPRVVDFLLTKQGLRRGKAMDVINSLTKKGVFRQLTVEQAAQVAKSWTDRTTNQA